LTITQSDGSVAGPVVAQILDDQGRQLQSTQVAGGHGVICDLGFGTHSIRVERDGYLPVTLSGVRAIFGLTQHLALIMNPIADRGSQGGGGNACRVYFRIRTVDDHPVPEADVLLNAHHFRADEYGRVLVLLRLRQFESVRIEHTGFRPEVLSLGCGQWDEEIDRTIILGRQ
jgi:hypothetical protein